LPNLEVLYTRLIIPCRTKFGRYPGSVAVQVIDIYRYLNHLSTARFDQHATSREAAGLPKTLAAATPQQAARRFR
jgi:hypothetical protein